MLRPDRSALSKSPPKPPLIICDYRPFSPVPVKKRRYQGLNISKGAMSHHIVTHVQAMMVSGHRDTTTPPKKTETQLPPQLPKPNTSYQLQPSADFALGRSDFGAWRARGRSRQGAGRRPAEADGGCSHRWRSPRLSSAFLLLLAPPGVLRVCSSDISVPPGENEGQ